MRCAKIWALGQGLWLIDFDAIFCTEKFSFTFLRHTLVLGHYLLLGFVMHVHNFLCLRCSKTVCTSFTAGLPVVGSGSGNKAKRRRTHRFFRFDWASFEGQI